MKKRDVTGSERDKCKDRSSHGESQWIAGLHVEEQAGHQAGEREGGDEAERQPECGETAALQEDLPQDVC